MINRLILYLKYLKVKNFPGKAYLIELHYQGYRDSHKTLGCTVRAELLYYLLKREGHEPTILKYSIKNNTPTNHSNFKKQFKHISGGKLPTHFVVYLDGEIYDPNLSLLKPISKEDYEIYAIIYPQSEILCEKVQPTQTQDELKRYTQERLFSEQFKSLLS